MILPFDEMNVLSQKKKQRSISIDKYFNEMELPKPEKEDRIQFANELNNILFEKMSLLYLLLIGKIAGTTLDSIKQELTRQISNLMKEYTYPDYELDSKINRYASNFVDITANRTNLILDGSEVENLFSDGLGKEVKLSDEDKSNSLIYWFSEDRARFNAEDTTNDLFNYEQYRQAIADGMIQKQWLTMKDERVRKTHAEVDDIVIPINSLFLVGDCYMRYAHDTEMGSAEETVNCRCTTIYF